MFSYSPLLIHRIFLSGYRRVSYLATLVLQWNDRQNYMRWVVPVVVDGILCYQGTPAQADGFSGIWINVEAREVATSNIQTNTMTLFEQVARGVEVDIKFVHLSGFHYFAVVTIVAVSGTQNAVRQVQSIALWVILARRININKLGSEVGVWGR